MDLTKNVNEIITDMAAAIDNLKEQILQAVYPVGSVYVSITDSRNPADILGFGTWEALPAGYGLVAQGTATAEDGSTLTFTAGQKTGEFKHQITVGELPTESPYGILSATQDGGLVTAAATDGGAYEGRLVVSGGSKEVYYGGGKRIDSISPAVGAYVWQRTA